MPIKYHSKIPAYIRKACDKLSDRIEEVDYEGEEDGYWLYLKRGFVLASSARSEGCHAIHEWKAKDVLDELKNIVVETIET